MERDPGPDPHARMERRRGSGADTEHPAAGRGRAAFGPFVGCGPRGYRRADERVRDDCERLTDDPWGDAPDIGGTLSGGEPTLDGTVDDRRRKRPAQDCVEDVPGITDVHGRLRARRADGAPEAMP